MRRPPNFHSYEHGGVPAPRLKFILPAAFLLPFLRWPLGYHVVYPSHAIARGVLFVLIPPVFWFFWEQLTGAPPPPNEGREYFICFVAAGVLLALLRFVRRVIGQHRGELVHGSEAGHSLLTWLLPLPVALTEQLLVPGLVGWLGWATAQSFSFDLGWWLMLSAGSYFLLANWEHRNRMAQRRAAVDDKVRAQAFADTIDRQEQLAARSQRRKTKSKPAPVHTAGDAPDIAEFGGGRRSRG